MGATPRAGVIVGSDGFLYGTSAEGGRARYGVIFKLRPDGTDYSVLHHFRSGNEDGAIPEADLLEGSEDGALYGTTTSGGRSDGGTVFKISKDGSGFELLHHFGTTNDGVFPAAAVIEASDGKLYGTTHRGGSGRVGTVFRINKDGTGYGLVHEFASGGSEGANVFGPVIEGHDGFLYGMTSISGAGLGNRRGTLFKVNKDGSNFTVLRTFRGWPTEPGNVQGGVIQTTDGRLYGVSANGGSADDGSVFGIDPDGQNLTVLRSFTSDPNPAIALEGLIQGQDGALYGATMHGGSKGYGTIFRMNKDGSDFAILHHFQDGGDGYNPRCKLAQAPSGELFGTTQSGGRGGPGSVFSLRTNGANYRIVWSFTFGGGDTQFPTAGLVEGPDGALYGTGSRGGEVGGGGAVFKVRKDGTGYTILRHFATVVGDGYGLGSGVTLGSDGKLYGVAEEGGNDGVGAVYKLGRDGTGYQILHHFQSVSGSRFPSGLLVQASDGFLYGVTRGPAPGTIFKVGTDGTDFETIRYLDALTDGADPQTALIRASDGFLYGTTPVAGMMGGGTVYRIGRDGSNFMVLRHFLSTSGEAQRILAGLLEGSDGMLYGTSSHGGLGMGTVFKINKDGSGYKVLHQFTSADRALWPFASLVEGRDRALYGTAYVGGTYDGGAVFKLNKDGSGFMVLHEFIGQEGYSCRATLLSGSDGALYGVTSNGGDLSFGVLFRIGHQLGLRKIDGAVPELEFTGVPGYPYALMRSVDLQNWTVQRIVIMPTVVSPRIVFSDPAAPAAAAFYRVDARVPMPHWP